jgi:hypothetical protein
MEAGDRVRLVRPPGQPNGIGSNAYPAQGYLTLMLVLGHRPLAMWVGATCAHAARGIHYETSIKAIPGTSRRH